MEKTFEIELYQLIAVCHIFDEYESFTTDLLDFIKSYDYRDLVWDLQKLSEGKKLIGISKKNKLIKEFYERNKKPIRTINVHLNMVEYIFNVYKSNGEFRDGKNLDVFYEYLKEHKDKINDIINLLNALKSLGIHSVSYNPDLDFTQELMSIYSYYGHNHHLYYMDNMKVIPTYTFDTINITTTGSPFKIIADPVGYKFSTYSRKVELSSFLFDIGLLPSEISKELFYDAIIEQRENMQRDINFLRNSVNFGISIDDLKNQFGRTSTIAKNLEEVKSKNELTELLTNIEEYIEKLAEFCSEYQKDVIEDHPVLTDDIISLEKKKYIERRNSVDID